MLTPFLSWWPLSLPVVMVVLSARLAIDWVLRAPDANGWIGVWAAERTETPSLRVSAMLPSGIRVVRPPNSSVKSRQQRPDLSRDMGKKVDWVPRLLLLLHAQAPLKEAIHGI